MFPSSFILFKFFHSQVFYEMKWAGTYVFQHIHTESTVHIITKRSIPLRSLLVSIRYGGLSPLKSGLTKIWPLTSIYMQTKRSDFQFGKFQNVEKFVIFRKRQDFTKGMHSYFQLWLKIVIDMQKSWSAFNKKTHLC